MKHTIRYTFFIFFIVSECKTKWTTLRNSFSRQLREEKKFTSGSGATKKGNSINYMITWHF